MQVGEVEDLRDERVGDLERGLGRNEQARAAYDDAEILYKEVGDRSGRAELASPRRFLSCL